MSFKLYFWFEVLSMFKNKLIKFLNGNFKLLAIGIDGSFNY